MQPIDHFIAARDLLQKLRLDPDLAEAQFEWPDLDEFNWALDYFDHVARGNDAPALWVVEDGGSEQKLSYAELSERSSRVANFFRAQGLNRGDRILVMLGNVVPIWETFLAAIKVGAVIIPSAPMLTPEDLEDRIERGGVSMVVTDVANAEKFAAFGDRLKRLLVGGEAEGWVPFEQGYDHPAAFVPDRPTPADSPLLLYFTSGTTAKPKLVMHTHQSYPVGHLSTMYWIGLQPGDRHLNISSPGWGKHAWSNLFAPFNAGACVMIHNVPRFDAKKLLQFLADYQVTTFCAPPTVWRMLLLEDLKSYPVLLRELVSAGEPLNPEIIDQVKAAWGLTIREGYGQTETTCQIGTPPGLEVRAGAMGRPLPGYRVVLLDEEGQEVPEGEISLRLDPPPVGLMHGYFDDPARTAQALGQGYYRTGDVAYRDAEGYLWYVGRADDVFKSSDYRISPFELESALIEHPLVVEAAVVPSPDPLRLSVPKAFVVLRPEVAPTMEVALDLFKFCREKLAPYKRIRRIEFAELPKTISGKIRRVQLRTLERERVAAKARGQHEFWEEDFSELKSQR